ncbi:MAG TPA: hypothetical protein VFE61_09995 [Candidatus Sulfotelmatobacter sp.]|nr:hypothetical protein [Candidatus Sulfotelmatobacter sp.]
MPRHFTRLLLVAGMARSIACIATDSADYRAGSLSKQSPQPIYAGDPHDTWNRIFYLPFTRTVESRLTDDFKEQGPFVTLDNVLGNPSLAVSKGMFERVEA